MTSRLRSDFLRVVASLSAAALTLGIAVAVTVAPLGAPRAAAANLAAFDPGNLVSDAVFFNGTDMSEADVQLFLNTKGAACKPSSSGIPCLKSYSQATQDRAADARCTRPYVGAPAEAAATIIAKVAQACGISARALLVMIQKEQGLVLGTGETLTARRYQIAMGFGCPDTAACDAQYYGFFNQVYRAAWQFKNYALNPTSYNHRAGAWNNVRFHPNAACGSSPVYIANQATAGLYNYTPYQPNGAALAAGYGSGDGCSSYGNRNFYSYFQDWFAAPAYETVGTIATWYRAGGAELLGPPTGNQVAVNGGYQQTFTRGIVSLTSSGVVTTIGGVNAGYVGTGAAWGPLGLATGAERWTAAGGWTQDFQNGTVYYGLSTGFSAALGSINTQYKQLGGPASSVGWALGMQRCTAGTCYQDFLRPSGAYASIISSDSTGAHIITNAIRSRWVASGTTSGLGAPFADEAVAADGKGSFARFTNNQREGIILWSASTGAQAFGGLFLDLWTVGGGVAGLGYPTMTEAATADGKGSYVEFRGTRDAIALWSAPTGAHAFGGGFYSYWKAAGGVRGLGYPTITESATPGVTGSYVDFTTGTRQASVYWSPTTGTHGLGGPVRDAWLAAGGLNTLGFPSTTEAATPDGRGAFVNFVRDKSLSSVVWSPTTGARAITGSVHTLWAAGGGLSGLGYPTSEAIATADGAGTITTFNGARDAVVVSSPTTGTHAFGGTFLDVWNRSGGVAGLGYPLTTEAAVPGATGSIVEFRNGGRTASALWSPSTGTHALGGPVRDAWLRTGGVTGLGFPTSTEAVTVDGGGAFVDFVRNGRTGTVLWSASTGAHSVGGPVRESWVRSGGVTGLGYPTTDETATAGGTGSFATFTRGGVEGIVLWSAPTGAHHFSGRSYTTWKAAGGVTAIGFPTADEAPVGTTGATRVPFTNGSWIVQSAASGSFVVPAQVQLAWTARGGATGSLGLPVSVATETGTTISQTFQGGVVTVAK
ncbi:hypothetical protein [Sanguibacter sp. 25GB23B1]|uniref:hypothetical protein n=1 Tax=unclassified Sanguibacter TaxID=2645534 RepID=UPI0032AFD4E1